MWFPEAGSESNAVGRITPDGQITRFPIPTPDSRPTGIALGPDGAMWFTENGASKIGRIDPPPGPAPAGSDESKPGAQPGGPVTAAPGGPAGADSVTAPARATPALGGIRLRPAAYRRGARRLPVLRVALTSGAAVELRIRRAGPGGTVRVTRRRRTRQGTVRIVLRDVRRLAPGRYVVEVAPIGADGTRGRTRATRLRIRP